MARDKKSSLAKRLDGKMEEWPLGNNRYFIPISEIERLVVRETVRREFHKMYPKMDPRSLDHYTNRICHSTQKLFTIVLCSSEGTHRRAIREIIDEGITDEDLPLARVYPTGSPSDPQIQRNKEYKLGTKEHKFCTLQDHTRCGIKALSRLQTIEIRSLCRDQWLALAPVFWSYRDSIPHHDLDDNVVLPYTEDLEKDKIKAGGYSEVWGVRIHPAHQKMLLSTDNQEPMIAIKRLLSRKRQDFEKESYMLTELTRRGHPHLIKLLTTYKFQDRYHLLSPFAKMNLRDYWKRNKHPRWDIETTLWMLTQLEGLASALDVIHNFETEVPLGSDRTAPEVSRKRPSMNVRMIVDSKEEKFGRHGDLKPENILWSDDFEGAGPGGILQIADLGLGRFHRLESRSQQDPTTINGSPTYVPPELALQKLVSRAYDIWSFGCIFLEFITWILEGSKGVEKFADARIATALDGIVDDNFYMLYNSRTGQRGEVRPQVTAWIQRLRQRRSGMIQDLLDLIQVNMLRVDAEDRIKSHVLRSRLRDILWRGQSDSVYLLGR